MPVCRTQDYQGHAEMRAHKGAQCAQVKIHLKSAVNISVPIR